MKQANERALVDARSYDLNGNLTSLKNDVAGNALTLSVSCLYDYRNRMVEYKDELTGQRHTYAYDALGRRIAKTVDADGVTGPPTTTRYFYGGESQWQVCEEQDGSGDTVATYVYGRYIDEVLQMQRCGTGILPVDCTTGRVAQVVLDLGSRFRPQVESGDANDVAR